MKKYETMINGKLIESTEHFEVRNPANNEVIGLAPISTSKEIELAVNSAKAAQVDWASRPNTERKELLLDVAGVLEENSEYLAKLITIEQGKPLAGPGSMFEMQACVAWMQVAASLDLDPEVVFEDDTRRDEVHYSALGVVAAIAPWNWPLMVAIWQISSAIRMGNAVVLKPSEYTPIGTLEMVRLINTVLPAGVLNVVNGNGIIGAQLVSNPDVDKIMFTGSTSTGKRIVESSTNNLARLTLELGGNDAAIVLADAKPQAIAEDLFWGAFLNMGQTCACAKRLYVHASIHDEVVAELKKLAEVMPMGNGLDEGVVLGPIQNQMQYDKVVDLVESAKADGATIICGGEANASDPGYFYPITLVTDITDEARLVKEEQFGPVLPIIKFEDIETAIASANALDVGLGASVWSSDDASAAKVAARVEAGTVWINQHGVVHPMVPFGGIKSSGYGSEFGIAGLKAVSQSKVISLKK